MASDESARNLSLAKRLAHSSDKSIRDAAFESISTWLGGASAEDEVHHKDVLSPSGHWLAPLHRF